jgi:hypothetical protein
MGKLKPFLMLREWTSVRPRSVGGVQRANIRSKGCVGVGEYQRTRGHAELVVSRVGNVRIISHVITTHSVC